MIPGKTYTPELILQIAWQRKWLMLIPALLIATGSVVYIRRLPNLYHSDTLVVVVPQRVSEQYVRSTVTTRIEDRLQNISQQILSRTRLEAIIQEFNLYPEARQTEIMEDIVAQMRRDVAVEIVRGDSFRVGFTSEDPRTAMRVAERLGSFFIDESLRDRGVLAEDTNQFLEAQLEDSRRRLVDTEKKVQQYRRQHDGELPTQVDVNMQGLHNAEMALQALTDSLNRDRDSHLVLERTIADATAAAETTAFTPASSATSEEPQASTATQQLQEAQRTLTGMLLRLKPEHPDVLAVKRTIAELQKRADAEALRGPVSGGTNSGVPPAEQARRNRLQEAREQLANLDKQMAAKATEQSRLQGVMADYQRRLEATPSRESELVGLMRDYDTLQQSYRSLLSKKEDSQISANLERRQIGEQFRIIDPARLPEKPFSPDRPRMYVMGILSAIAVGLTLAAAAEYMDQGLRSEEDVKLALSLPVLAAVPMIHNAATKARRRLVAWLITGAAAAVVSIGAAVAWRLLR